MWKRFIAMLLMFMSIITLVPLNAKAFTEGIIGSGGSGDPWICGAKAWPCFTITILEDTYTEPLKDLLETKQNYEGIQEFREQVRSEFKDRVPNTPCGESDTSGRLYIMPTWLGNGSSLKNSVNDILKYDYNNPLAFRLDSDSSWRNMYKLTHSEPQLPGSFKELRGKLYDYIKAHEGNISDLYDKWGTAETNTTYNYDEAIRALSYLFSSDSGIEVRLGEMLYDDYYGNHPEDCFTADGQYYQKAAMIAVGMVLYYAAYDSKVKSYYQRRINEFIMNDDSKNKKTPFIIEIEPASVWVDKAGRYGILNCIDFLDMYSATDLYGSLRQKGWNTYEYDLFQLMSASWTRSLNKLPGRADYQRFFYTQGQKWDEYTYGFSLPTGIWYGLNGSQVDTAMGTVAGYIKNFYFFKQMYGFLLGFNSSLISNEHPVSGSQDISTEEPGLKIIDQHQETINENPKITLKSNTDATAIKKWKDKYEGTKPGFIIAASISKTEGPNSMINSLGRLPNNEDDQTELTYDELLQFLEGTLTFDFEDQLTGTPIANDQEIKNEYKSQVWITENVPDDKKDWVELTPNDGLAKKVYKREPIKPYYISSPVTYSEIKNNEPEEEEWEAMAGVPTTEQLYFASGGSEFIVDIELEYVPDQTTTRNYKVEFTKVACDLSGSKSCKSDEGHEKGDCGQHYDCADDHMIKSSPITWTQTINYDYMKINKCQVWKIEKSKVDGMSKITRADDEITATIQTGDPSAFWNVAKSDNAAGGRILYSLEPDQMDNVVWTIPTNESCKNHQALDAQRVESEFKTKLNQATVVSDFLILQTNKGDQSVMYFDKKSNTVRCDTNFEFEKSDEDTMWKNNPNSAANWEEDHITVSSYNGKYKNVDTKYKSKGQGSTVNTAFDSASYGQVMSRPSRPGDQMLLYETFNPYVKNINGLYKTGDAVTFYKHIVNEGKESTVYSDSDEAKTRFGSEGMILESNYSPSHSKVNDIVLHDPVSTEKAMVVPLDEERDQRTSDTKPALNPPKQDAVEYIDVLPDDYMNNIIFNGYCRYLNSKKTSLGWLMEGDVNNAKFGSTTSNVIQDDESAWTKENDKYWDGVQRSFLITNKTNTTSYYTQSFSVDPGKTFLFKGNIKASNNAHFGIEFLDDKEKQLDYKTTKSELKITAPANTVKIKIYLVNQGSGEARFDNIQLYCESNQGRFTENDLSAKDWKTVKNPLYHSHAESGCTKIVNYVCNNKPLNAGGTLGYKYRGYCSNHGYSYYYLKDYKGERVNVNNVSSSDILKEVTNCSAYSKNMEYVGTEFINAPTYHVHTDACIGGDSDIITDWNFNSGLNGFTSGTATITHSNNALHSNIKKADNYFYSPTINKSSSDFDIVEITVKNDSQGTNGAIYFSSSAGGYSESRRVSFYMEPNADYKTYSIKMSTHSGWVDTIKSLRFDIANGVTSGSFDISSIRLRKSNGSGGVEWSCGRIDTSVPYKVLDKCTGELNAGGSGKYYLITHGDGCTYEEQTHTSTSPSPCTQCGHSCGGTIVEKNTYDRHEHTDACYSVHSPEPKEIMGWYAASIQPYRNPQPWEYIQKIKEPDPYKEVSTPAGTFKPGNFINLDYPFQVYFPNEGDFEGTNELGIRKTTKNRGYGFEDNMDTTKWTARKYVKFEFDVIFNGKLYGAGEEIDLDVDEDMFDFYCPLENKEYLQSKVTFVAIAINNKYDGLDNDETTNKIRGSSKLRAKHSAIKTAYIDVVGRIGNMTIQDTGDFRFSNFFKKSFNNGEWLIPNIVPTVDMNSQNYIVGEQQDIRGLDFDENDGAYLNTYGTEDHKEQKPYAFPLSPVYNNIEALRRQPLRIGYPVYMDIETLGDYIQGKVQVLPYYYALDVNTGKIKALDVYMSVNGSYKLINKFDKLDSDGKVITDGIYDNKVFLNWTEESIRRNYTGEQINLTKDGTEFYTNRYTNANIQGFEGPSTAKAQPPYGQFYVMGNNNALMLTPRARTLFATEENYDGNKNPGNRVNKLDYTIQGQRWHFTISLPSTAVFVEANKQPTTSNIEKVCNDQTIVLTAIDVKAMGTQYALRADVPVNEITLQVVKKDGSIENRTFDISNLKYITSTGSSSGGNNSNGSTSGGNNSNGSTSGGGNNSNGSSSGGNNSNGSTSGGNNSNGSSSGGGNNSNGSSSGGGSGGSKVIVSITSSNKSSRDDLTVSGTH